jgi:hypothetical protein
MLIECIPPSASMQHTSAAPLSTCCAQQWQHRDDCMITCLHAPAACTCCMHLLRAPAACTCCVHLLQHSTTSATHGSTTAALPTPVPTHPARYTPPPQEDPFNAIIAGTLTGGFLQLRSGLRPAFRSAVFGGMLLVSTARLGPQLCCRAPGAVVTTLSADMLLPCSAWHVWPLRSFYGIL